MAQIGTKSPNSCFQLTPPLLPRQAGVDESQACAARLILKEVKDRAEVETTLQTGQEVSESGIGEHAG